MLEQDGYDVQMQTNHLSHFLLTKEMPGSHQVISSTAMGPKEFVDACGPEVPSVFKHGKSCVRVHLHDTPESLADLTLNEKVLLVKVV